MDKVSARGLLFQYSETVSRTLTGSSPNQFYEPVEPGDGTFITLGCIKDVPNVGNETYEMAEHRCLDDTEKFVSQFPTGYVTSEPTTIKLAFLRDTYTDLLALARTGTELCFRLKYAATVNETLPSKVVRNGHIAAISDMVPGDGKEVDITVTVAWSEMMKFVEGS